MKKTVEPFNRYVDQMEEIKKRLDVISHLMYGQGNVLYLQSTVESVGLQFRKILELIAFASLIANQEVYAQVHQDFSKHHKANVLLNNLRLINPRFYPIPVAPKPQLIDGILVPELLKDGYLTPEDFLYVFEKCGRLLHVDNPYKGRLSMDFYKKAFPLWLDKIYRLLNVHLIHFVDDARMWIVNMVEEPDLKVRCNVYEQIC